MASRFSKLLAATGIIQLDEGAEARGEAVPAEPKPATGTAASSSKPATVTAPEAGVVAEQRPLDELYKQANVPASPFAAEKLLRLLDGLSALPLEVRKQMVKAMDEADDSWTIDDVVLDAQRKMKVLATAKETIAGQLAGAAKNAEDEAAAIAKRQFESAGQIRRQIAELNALLERESTKATQAVAEVNAKAKANQEAGARELARLDSEISRLSQIPANFAGKPSA